MAAVSQPNPFEVLDLPVQFGDISSQVDSRLRDLATQYHPDRMVRESEAVKMQALQKMSAITQAARELRTPEGRRNAVLRLNGIAHEQGKTIKSSVAMEWAGRWFEVQEDETAEVAAKFLKELNEKVVELNSKRASLESHWDQKSDAPVLAEIAEVSTELQTLQSLNRDVEQWLSKLKKTS